MNKSLLHHFHLFMFQLDENCGLKNSGSSLFGGNNPDLQGLLITNVCGSFIRIIHHKMIYLYVNKHASKYV